MSTSNGRIHQYSATFEAADKKNVGVRLTYTGSHDFGLNYSVNIDKQEPSLATYNSALQPYPEYSSASYWRGNGQTKFNSLTVEGERKVGQLTFIGHWAWSSSLDNMSEPGESLCAAALEPRLISFHEFGGGKRVMADSGGPRPSVPFAHAGHGPFYSGRVEPHVGFDGRIRTFLLAQLFWIGRVSHQHFPAGCRTVSAIAMFLQPTHRHALVQCLLLHRSPRPALSAIPGSTSWLDRGTWCRM